MSEGAVTVRVHICFQKRSRRVFVCVYHYYYEIGETLKDGS